MGRKKERTPHPSAASVNRYGAGNIRARVIDEENGLRVLAGVCVVRIRSKEYNLLIMEDYLPTLGKIDGSVTFLTREEEYRLDGVKGFYKHQHNEFTLLLEKQASTTVSKNSPQDGGGKR